MSYLKPPTVLGYVADEAVSAIQKMIRRGEPEQATAFAIELARTSKGYWTWAYNRLLTTLHEDVGPYDLQAATVAGGYLERARFVRDGAETGWESWVAAGIAFMCGVDKTRIAGHLWCVVDAELAVLPPSSEPPTDVLLRAFTLLDHGKEKEALRELMPLGRRQDKRAAFKAAALAMPIYVQARYFNDGSYVREYLEMCCRHMVYFHEKGKDDWEYPLSNFCLVTARNKALTDGNPILAAKAMELLGQKLPVPDVALDMHTHRGKKLKRGFPHFFAEGAKLVPEALIPDPYKLDAVRIWTERGADVNAKQATPALMNGKASAKTEPAPAADMYDDLPTSDLGAF